MPDEFPTFEVVAFIGVVAALVSIFQLRSGLREIPELSRALEEALRAGDLAKARALTLKAEGAAFGRVGHAVVEALGRERRPGQRELESILAQARRRNAAAAQRGRARDLVVSAVLIGAGAYAVRASLGVGRVFYAMLGGALVVTALGPILRRTMLDAVVRASDGLLRAASAYLLIKGTPGAVSCPECGSHDSLKIGSPALDALGDLGLRELDVCRQCGFTRGRVEHPDAIRVDDARGVRTRAVEPELESSAEPDAEHPG